MVYVDRLMKWPSGTWCHLWADTEEELHATAAKIGLQRSWYQGDHYDLRPSKRELALAAGAVVGTLQDMKAFLRRRAEHEKVAK